jgi:hypothetical protein
MNESIRFLDHRESENVGTDCSKAGRNDQNWRPFSRSIAD